MHSNHANAPQSHLYPLLHHLSEHPQARTFQGWQVQPIPGGMNNLVYQVCNADEQYAVKFTIRDARDRAGREYQALSALQAAGLNIAPQPVLLDRESFPQPVIVQTWLEGHVTGEPPLSREDWLSLVQHFAAIHTVTPHRIKYSLPEGVLTCWDIPSGIALIHNQMALIPPTEQPAELLTLAQQIRQTLFPPIHTKRVSLCRVDANIRNMIQRPGAWASVDWENSGWGDPAFEIADLMAHPAYEGVSQNAWAWMVDTYSRLTDDPAIVTRIQSYYLILLVWWVARLVRARYEVARGLDARLVARSPDWADKNQAQTRHYLSLAWDVGQRDWGW